MKLQVTKEVRYGDILRSFVAGISAIGLPKETDPFFAARFGF